MAWCSCDELVIDEPQRRHRVRVPQHQHARRHQRRVRGHEQENLLHAAQDPRRRHRDAQCRARLQERRVRRPGTYPHNGKTYHVKSIVGMTAIPASMATECAGVSTTDAAALFVPTIDEHDLRRRRLDSSADLTVTLLCGVVQ